MTQYERLCDEDLNELKRKSHALDWLEEQNVDWWEWGCRENQLTVEWQETSTGRDPRRNTTTNAANFIEAIEQLKQQMEGGE